MYKICTKGAKNDIINNIIKINYYIKILLLFIERGLFIMAKGNKVFLKGKLLENFQVKDLRSNYFKSNHFLTSELQFKNGDQEQEEMYYQNRLVLKHKGEYESTILLVFPRKLIQRPLENVADKFVGITGVYKREKYINPYGIRSVRDYVLVDDIEFLNVVDEYKNEIFIEGMIVRIVYTGKKGSLVAEVDVCLGEHKNMCIPCMVKGENVGYVKNLIPSYNIKIKGRIKESDIIMSKFMNNIIQVESIE